MTNTRKCTTEEYNKFCWKTPNSNLSTANIQLSYNMCFTKDGVEVGKIDWNGPEMIFSGKLAPRAFLTI